LLYDAEEFEETSPDLNQVYMEAYAIYWIVYASEAYQEHRQVSLRVGGRRSRAVYARKYAMQSGGKTRALPAFSYPPALMMKRGPGSD
jgi:RNA-dependent RNA polymerase